MPNAKSVSIALQLQASPHREQVIFYALSGFLYFTHGVIVVGLYQNNKLFCIYFKLFLSK
jgi:hypothetical protein